MIHLRCLSRCPKRRRPTRTATDTFTIARSGDDRDANMKQQHDKKWSSIRSKRIMPVWMVKATWIGDEAEASEQWEVSAIRLIAR